MKTDTDIECLNNTALSAHYHDHQERNVRVIDYPCGSGKTTALLNSLIRGKSYLVVVPYLSECERVISSTASRYGEGFFVQPVSDGITPKQEDLRNLLIEGQNVVTTHSLYSLIAPMCEEGLLDDYHIIIDEVLEPAEVKPKPKATSWKEFYVDDGFVSVCDETHRVQVTDKWKAQYELVNDTLNRNIYAWASTNCLYDIGDSFFILTIPEALLKAGRSFTIYTYKAEGSLLMQFLRWAGINAELVTDEALEEAMKRKARELIDLRLMTSLKDVKLSHSRQTKHTAGSDSARKVATALSNLNQRELKGIDQKNILVTCSKSNWYRSGKGPKETPSPKAGPYAAQSRLFKGATWLPNTTRGTNQYIEASHLIYLYDQYPNHLVGRLFGQSYQQPLKDAYALTELIQWVWRSRIRKGEPITLYMGSKRMYEVFDNWRKSPPSAFQSDYPTH